MPNVFYLHEEGIEDTIINQIEYQKKKKKGIGKKPGRKGEGWRGKKYVKMLGDWVTGSVVDKRPILKKVVGGLFLLKEP